MMLTMISNSKSTTSHTNRPTTALRGCTPAVGQIGRMGADIGVGQALEAVDGFLGKSVAWVLCSSAGCDQ